MSADKPTLTLLPGKALSPEVLLNLFRPLTGREPTEEEKERVRRKWEAAVANGLPQEEQPR